MGTRTARIGLLLILVLGVGWGIVHASAGDLDSTFGSGGRVSTDFHHTADEARAVAIQPDGKIVVVGTTHISGDNYNFSVARYHPDGSPDTTFSGDGHLTTDTFNGSNDGANAVAIQPDGKIVVAGYGGTSAYRDFAVVRYNPDGSLDTTFSGDGIIWIVFDLQFQAVYGIAIQEDGKIVLAGYGSQGGGGQNFALARLNPDGSLDTTFSGDGRLTTDFFGGIDEARAVVVRHDGKIVVAGFAQVSGSNYDFALARYNANGSLDTTFSGDGKATVNFFGADDKAYAMAWQDDGKFVLAGANWLDCCGYNFAIARFHANGTLDTTFDIDGIQTINFADGTAEEVALGVVQQADRKLVVVGYAPVGGINDFALVRLHPDGSLDTTFGSGGRVTHDFGGGVAIAYGVAIQPDGRIVTAGTAYMGDTNGYDFAVARYLPSDLPTPTPTPPTRYGYVPLVLK